MNENKNLPEDKFQLNEVETIADKPTIVNLANPLLLVNKDFYLPKDYKPADLARPDVRFSFASEDVDKSYMRVEAAVQLEAMFHAAEREEDLILYAVSGFRSYERQGEIFSAKISATSEEEARKVIALPGQSEHQSGLAMDISSASNDYSLTEAFAQTYEGKWLAQNAYRFGYILRYPKEKEAITKYSYEPWHFRYVGKDAAEIIFKEDLSLEEFYENMKAI